MEKKQLEGQRVGRSTQIHQAQKPRPRRTPLDPLAQPLPGLRMRDGEYDLLFEQLSRNGVGRLADGADLAIGLVAELTP